MCRHYRRHHQEVFDTMLWRKLPQEVVQHVCAFLPLSQTMELQKLIKPWSRMHAVTNYRQSCARAHPKLFGLSLYSSVFGQWNLVVFDSNIGKWLQLSLPSSTPINVSSALTFNNLPLYGHDGGLICLSPSCRSRLYIEDRWILVYNPLTGDEKYLPPPHRLNEECTAILLQLLVDANTGSYKVNMVSRRSDESYEAESYDSNTGRWSTLASGYVCGSGVLNSHYEPIIFDCASKQICKNASFEDNPEVEDYLFVGDKCLLLYHDVEERNDYGDLCYRVLESVWKNGWSLGSTTNIMLWSESSFEHKLFASKHYLLVIQDGSLLVYERATHEQVMKNNLSQFSALEGLDILHHNIYFICDLNWAATP